MYRCTKCGSYEVEMLAWIDLNTGEEKDGDVGEYYCRSCESHTDVESDDLPEEDDELNNDIDD